MSFSELGRVIDTLVKDRGIGREVIVQAGGLSEHRFKTVAHDTTETSYPGAKGDYAADIADIQSVTTRIDDTHLRVILPAATNIRLDFEMDRYVNQPKY